MRAKEKIAAIEPHCIFLINGLDGVHLYHVSKAVM
jgi:hypothetical protein